MDFERNKISPGSPANLVVRDNRNIALLRSNEFPKEYLVVKKDYYKHRKYNNYDHDDHDHDDHNNLEISLKRMNMDEEQKAKDKKLFDTPSGDIDQLAFLTEVELNNFHIPLNSTLVPANTVKRNSIYVKIRTVT